MLANAGLHIEGRKGGIGCWVEERMPAQSSMLSNQQEMVIGVTVLRQVEGAAGVTLELGAVIDRIEQPVWYKIRRAVFAEMVEARGERAMDHGVPHARVASQIPLFRKVGIGIVAEGLAETCVGILGGSERAGGQPILDDRIGGTIPGVVETAP